MKNADYWKLRFSQLEQLSFTSAAQTKAFIDEQYKVATAEIEKQISTWYARFAKNNEISITEARKMLSASDLKELKWDINEYIKYGHENGLSADWSKELENASAKFHISKLEALKLQTQMTCNKLFGKQIDSVTELLKGTYLNGYYHSAYEIQHGLNVGWNIAAIDENKLSKVMGKPWTTDGLNFSDRIWSNRESLINETHKQLTQDILLGRSPDSSIKAITKKFNTSKSKAGRLVMTESAYFGSEAQKDCFKELDVEKFEIVETLDGETCSICSAMDGQVYSMKDFESGVTAPPFHPWCRGCTVPYFDDNYTERAARDADGKTYYVPSDMKYPEWKEKFVDNDDLTGFDVYEQNGVTHYTKQQEPEPVKPKKEYLTKKKLQANIANADVQLEDLNNQFSNITQGWTYDEVIDNYGSLDLAYEGANADELDDLKKLKDLEQQILPIKEQKAEWQEKLNEKLIKEQKKALIKQQLELQKQLDDFEIETYSGIWKDDVTTLDWNVKQYSIDAKKKYYENKFITETDTDLMKKHQDLYKQLDDFDKKGKSYYEIQAELKKVQADLTNLNKNGIIKDKELEAFSDERKNNALWFNSKNGGFSAADAYFDSKAKNIFAGATKGEHHGFYTYTSGSGGHNRPLAGFEKPWSESGTGWEAKFYKGANNVWIDFEGKGDDIRNLTTLISKSTYDKDVWLQSGQNYATLEGFLNIPYGTLSKMSDSELQKFVGVKDKFYQSMSTAVNKGGGSIFNSKPMKLNIYAPQGSQMLYASDVGAFGKAENELILQRGGTYKITKIYWGIDDTDGGTRKLFVDMELHPEEGYDLFQQDPTEWKGSRKNYRD